MALLCWQDVAVSSGSACRSVSLELIGYMLKQVMKLLFLPPSPLVAGRSCVEWQRVHQRLS